jgi:hypothetical protein
MIKFKITIDNTTIEFPTRQDAEAYLTNLGLQLEIVEFYDPTLEGI